MIYKFNNGGIVKLQNAGNVPEDEQFDSIRPAHKIDLSKARRRDIRKFARNLAGMDNPEYGATAKDYQEGFVNLGLNKRKSKFFDRVFRDQLAKNLEHTDRINRDQQVIQAVKEGNFDPEQFGEWLALKRDESPITQKFVIPLVTGAAFGPAMAVASLAGEATNLGTNAVTGWDTWGKALASSRKGWSEAAELTNPGYIVTGPLANGGQRLVQGWKTVANSTKDLQNQAVTKIAKELSKNVSKSKFVPAQVKYYGPTMGKSYAAKTNPNLIDLDTWGRSEYDQLAKKYGYKDWREMILSDKGDYNEEYKQLVKDQIKRIQSDPQYSGKTIVVSNASLLKPDSGITFANTPVIPERSVMATRNNIRHPWESIEHGEEWWDSLQRKGTPLRIDNRFVSEIEGNKVIPFTSIPQKSVYYELPHFAGGKVDTSDPNMRQQIIKAFKERYPNFVEEIPFEFTTSGNKYWQVGKLPTSYDLILHKDLIGRRLDKLSGNWRDNYGYFVNPETHSAGIYKGRDIFGTLGKTDANVVIPATVEGQYGGWHSLAGSRAGESFVQADAWRTKPARFTHLHESISHPMDAFIGNVKSDLSDMSIKDLYTRISQPKDLFPNYKDVLHKESLGWVEARSTNNEMIKRINEIISKETGKTLSEVYADSSLLEKFVDTKLKDNQSLIKFMDSMDSGYLSDYAKLLKENAGTPEAKTYANRIRAMIKTLPSIAGVGIIGTSTLKEKQGGILKAQRGTGLSGIPIIGNLAKKGFELVAKRSNGAQTKSIPTIIGDVITGRDKSFYNINNSNGSNEIDTYLYGKPYNSEFIGDASIGPDYTNYINKNYPNRNIKTYNTHFGDTLYIDDKAKSLVEKQLNTGEVVGGSMGRYAHAPSYIVTTEEGRPYDAGGHLIKFSKDENGNIVANMSDIYDFLPEDFNNKYDQTENPSWTRNFANNIGTPFIVRQNNIPVVFKEIVPEYKTEKQRQLGDFLSQWGNTYDLKLPLRLSDEQIDEIFDGRDYGDDILDFMIDKGYIKPVYKSGGILKAQHGFDLSRLNWTDISNHILGFAADVRNKINKMNKYTPEMVPVIGTDSLKTERRSKIGPLVSARGKDPKIVEDGGIVKS